MEKNEHVEFRYSENIRIVQVITPPPNLYAQYGNDRNGKNLPIVALALIEMREGENGDGEWTACQDIKPVVIGSEGACAFASDITGFSGLSDWENSRMNPVARLYDNDWS